MPRGIKICTCGKHNGPRTKVCECGHVFIERPPTVKYEPIGLKKGQKLCPSCKKTCGPRSFACPHCQYDFNPGQKVKVEVKEAKLIVKQKIIGFVTDWKALEPGTVVKVQGGAGDHYYNEQNERVYLQDSGTYTISGHDESGLIVYGKSGHGYVYMGVPKMSGISSMIHKEPHHLIVVGKKIA